MTVITMSRNELTRGRETDSPLDGDGFEPSVPHPRRRDFCHSAKDATACRVSRTPRRPPRNGLSLGGGTASSNPPPSSAESVSAVNFRAVGGEARGFAALCVYTETREGRDTREPVPFVSFSLT
jgi:hypothetical protein